MTDYKCLECGEELEYKQHCVLHAIEWKHKNYEIVATDKKIVITA
jgi:DNA-directed RNA polymerase subunit RPC12/RpoP